MTPIRLRDRLFYKQARTAVLVAFGLGLALSLFQIAADVIRENERIDQSVLHSLETVKDSAAEAAFEVNAKLARKVARGLFGTDFLNKVIIKDDFGNILAHIERPLTTGYLDWLAAIAFQKNRIHQVPLFVRDEKIRVGTLIVGIDSYLSAASFFERSSLIVVSGIVRNLLLAGILAFLFYLSLAKPFLATIHELGEVRPERPDKNLLPIPDGHQRDELGQLITTLNSFLVSLGRNLEGREQAEQALRDSERKYRGLMEQASDGIVIYDFEGDIQDVNSALCSMLGYTETELQNINFREIVSPQDQAETPLNFEELRDGRRLLRERQFVRKDGSFVHGEVSAKMMEDGDLQAIVRDISGRLEAENSKKEIENRFITFIDNSPYGVYLKDLEGRFVIVNKTFAEWRGIGVDEIVGLTGFDIHPAELAEQFTNHDREVLNSNETVTKMTKSLFSDGQEHDLMDIKFPVKGIDGKPLYIGGINIDVSNLIQVQQDLKEREEDIRLLLSSTAEAIYGIDLNGVCTFCNKATLGFLGYDHEEQLLGKHMHSLMHHMRKDGSVYPAEECRIYDSIRHGSGIHVDDEVLWRRDGTSFPAEYWSYPIKRNGEITGSVVTFLDITDRVHAEEALLQVQKMEAIGNLTGGIAHDFNNLLFVITSKLEVLKAIMGKDDISEENKQKRIDVAIEAANRGAELTQRLLAFSRKQVLRPSELNPDEIIEDMIMMLGRTLGEDIKIDTKLAANVLIKVDRNAFENAILNLAINSRAAMQEGGTMTFQSSLTDGAAITRDDDGPHMADRAFVEVKVADTGTGMAHEVLEHAFEPYFTTKEVGEGSGLGLSMVYGFVKQSGGDILLESEVGKGTAVRMFLPLVVKKNNTETSPPGD